MQVGPHLWVRKKLTIRHSVSLKTNVRFSSQHLCWLIDASIFEKKIGTTCVLDESDMALQSFENKRKMYHGLSPCISPSSESLFTQGTLEREKIAITVVVAAVAAAVVATSKLDTTKERKENTIDVETHR